MKRVLMLISTFILPAVALANNVGPGNMDNGNSLADQLNELLPFVHYQEGHWAAVVVSLALWASLIYTAKILLKKYRKGR